MSQLSERELWLAVAQIPGIGPRTFYQLLDTFGSMRELWTASTTDIRWMPVKLANAHWRLAQTAAGI